MEGYAQFDDSNLINDSVQMEMEFFERAADSSAENLEESDEIIVTFTQSNHFLQFLLAYKKVFPLASKFLLRLEALSEVEFSK